MNWIIKTITDKRLAKRKRRWEKRWKNSGNSLDKKRALHSIYRAELRKKPTKEELIVGQFLTDTKTNFQFQRGFLVPFHRIVDFYIPHNKIIIEVDGGYHKTTLEKDKLKDDIWKKRGIRTVRITNEQVLDGSFIPLISNFRKKL